MFDPSEISEGEARLTPAKKLEPADVSKLVSLFRGFIGSLENRNGYKFQETFAALTDAGNDNKIAAQFAAALIRIEDDLQFGVSAIVPTTGARGNLAYKESDEIRAVLLYLFGLLYPIPTELDNLTNGNQTKQGISRLGSSYGFFRRF